MDISRIVNETCELNSPLRPVRLGQDLFAGERDALTLRVRVTRDGEAVALEGVGVSAVLLRADGSALVFTGRAEGAVASAVLPQAAYAVPGEATLLLRVLSGGAVKTVFWGECVIRAADTAQAVTAGEPLPNLDTVLAAIARCDSAAAAAEQAVAGLEDAVAAYALPFSADGEETVTCRPAENTRLRVRLTLRAAFGGSGAPAPDNIRPIAPLTAATLTHTGSLGDAAAYPVPVSAPLLHAVLDWQTGELSEAGVLIRLTGQETVTVATVGGRPRYAVDLGQAGFDIAQSLRLGLCSHFDMNGMPLSANGNAQDNSAAVGSSYLYLRCDAMADPAALSAWLAAQHEAGTPVTVLLLKAVPVRRSVGALPVLRAFPGENTLSAPHAALHVTGTLDAAALLERLGEA